MKFDLAELVKCAEREVAMRKSAYPKWIESKRVTQEWADTELAKMEQIAAILKWISSAGSEEIKKALAIKAWIDKVGGDRVKLSLKVLADIEENADAIAAIYNDEAIALLMKAFPGAKLAGVKQLGAAA